MSEEHIDFESVDPTADPARFDHLVRTITESAAGELERRRARATVVGQISSWRRPLLTAAAVTAIMSGAVLWQTRERQMGEIVDSGVAAAIGVPTQLSRWVQDEGTPTPAQLLIALVEVQ